MFTSSWSDCLHGDHNQLLLLTSPKKVTAYCVISPKKETAYCVMFTSSWSDCLHGDYDQLCSPGWATFSCFTAAFTHHKEFTSQAVDKP